MFVYEVFLVQMRENADQKSYKATLFMQCWTFALAEK